MFKIPALTTAALLATLPLSAHAQVTLGGLGYADAVMNAPGLEQVDEFTLIAPEDILTLPATNEDGSIRAIIEIPTGTSAKWESTKDEPNQIFWEFRNDAPRVVNYLGYPGNYGAIPSTLLPEEMGGDGDALDVLVLGQAVPRGEVLDVRLIGVLKMLDGGEQDDKLIAVMTENSPFAHIESIEQLDAEFPGVTEIVDLWFTNYKGPDGGIESSGFDNADAAMEVLEAAMGHYEDSL